MSGPDIELPPAPVPFDLDPSRSLRASVMRVGVSALWWSVGGEGALVALVEHSCGAHAFPAAACPWAHPVARSDTQRCSSVGGLISSNDQLATARRALALALGLNARRWRALPIAGVVGLVLLAPPAWRHATAELQQHGSSSTLEALRLCEHTSLRGETEGERRRSLLPDARTHDPRQPDAPLEGRDASLPRAAQH